MCLFALEEIVVELNIHAYGLGGYVYRQQLAGPKMPVKNPGSNHNIFVNPCMDVVRRLWNPSSSLYAGRIGEQMTRAEETCHSSKEPRLIHSFTH